MGSTVVSEVVNNIHPWANMIDTRSHHSERTKYDPSNLYRHTSTPPSSTLSSNSRRRTPSNDASLRAPSAANRQQPTQPIPISGSSRDHKSQDAPAQTPIASNQAASPSQETRPSSPPESPSLPPSANPHPHMSSDSSAAMGEAASTSNSNSIASSPQVQGYSGDSPQRIKVRDLQHIQSFALEAVNANPSSAADSEKSYAASPQYEISDMPIADIIEMVAGLLTKITATNDQHYEHLHRQLAPPETSADIGSQTSSVLAFHGKNVPSITILSYLTRIHKYCPATWEVFLSLLVYFDRMTERVNSGPMQSLRQANKEFLDRSARNSQVSMAEASQEAESRARASASSPQAHSSNSVSWEADSSAENCNLSHFFVVDSFNIHRLVIAGVTCAAKYFSDIFFTNSRYAKVGGLPLVELNHLELQFLVLNDFRLAVPVEELEAYATMLVEFYAREVAAQQQPEQAEGIEMVTR